MRTSAGAPYKGLSYYGVGDAELFFGRKDECAQIILNLQARRLVIVYGPSGVGKSSLLRAGVAANLREHAEADRDELGTPEFVPVVFNTWRDDPLTALTNVIAQGVQDFTGKVVGGAGTLADQLDRVGETTDSSVLVILDQFEDYALYHPAQDTEDRFSREFAEAVVRPELPVGFLVAIREDALAELDRRFKRSIPGLFDTALSISPLDRKAAAEAIEGPLDRYNEENGLIGEDKVGIKPDLVPTILDEVEINAVVLEQEGMGIVKAKGNGAARAGPIEASYLQLVMTRLWDAEIGDSTASGSGRQLRRETLQRLGGAGQIVKTHLDTVLKQQLLSEDERDTAAAMFRFLVTPSGAKIALSAADLANMAERPVGAVTEILRSLADEPGGRTAGTETGSPVRIIRAVGPAPGTTEERYEIFHDVLAAAITDWRMARMRERVEEDARKEADARAEAARMRADEARDEAQRLESEKRKADEQADEARRQKAIADDQAKRADEARGRAETLARRLVYLAVVLLVAIAVAVIFIVKSEQNASTARKEARLNLSNAVAGQARRLLPVDARLASLLSLKAYGLEPNDPEAKAVLTDALDLPLHRILTGAATTDHPLDAVNSVAYSPRGRLVATGDEKGRLTVWNPATGAQTSPKVMPGERPITSVVFNPAGTLLAAGDQGGEIVIWNVGVTRADRVTLTRSQPPVHLPHRAGYVWSLAFDRTGRLLASGDDSGDIVLWRVRGGSLDPTGRRVLPAGANNVYSLAFSRAGRSFLASGDQNGRVLLWDPTRPATSTPVASFPHGHSYVFSLAFSANGALLAGGDDAGHVEVWSVASRAHVHPPMTPSGAAVRSVAFGHNGMLASADYAGKVVLWYPRSGTRAAEPLPDGRVVQSVAFSLSGDTLASGDEAGQVVLWDVAPHSRAGPPLLHDPTAIRTLAFSPKRGILAVGDAGGAVRLLRGKGGKTQLQMPGRRPIRSVAFSSDGKMLAAGDEKGGVLLWNLVTGAHHINPSSDSRKELSQLAFSSTGLLALAAHEPGEVVVWKVGDQVTLGKPQWTMAINQGPAYSVAFSGDGRRLAVGTSGVNAGNVLIVSSTTGKRLEPNLYDPSPVRGLTFTRDGIPVSGDDLGDLTFWTSARATPRVAEGGPITSVAASVAGRNMVATAGSDGAIELWNPATGARVRRIPGDGSKLAAVAFSPDGSELASGSESGSVVLSRTHFGEGSYPQIKAQICSEVRDGLDADEWKQYLPGEPFEKLC
jgi:WD40 repeat protein